MLMIQFNVGFTEVVPTVITITIMIIIIIIIIMIIII